MPVPKLKDAEVTADGIERFVRTDVGLLARAWWNGTRLSPAFERIVNYQRPATNYQPS